MKRETFILILAVLVAAPLLSGCPESSPVAPDGPIRDGLPDWNQRRYDFIGEISDHCQLYRALRTWWDPKFEVYVWEVSSDDQDLVVPYPNGLGLFEYRANVSRQLTEMSIERVERSHDGRYLIATRQGVGELWTFVVHDFLENRWTQIVLPDSLIFAMSEAHWLPGDTSVVITASFAPSVWGQYELSVREPFQVRKYSGQMFDGHANGKWYRMVTPLQSDPDKTVRLLVGTLDDTAEPEINVLQNAISTSPGRISPDGNWLSIEVVVSLQGTRFDKHGKIGGLGIIDLRANSPMQYQFFRFFPDHTHLRRNCGGPFPDVSGAWAADSRHIYYERVRIADSTMQYARLDILTGDEEIVSDFK